MSDPGWIPPEATTVSDRATEPLHLAVVGGDQRDGEAAAWLAARGYRVRTFACPVPGRWRRLEAPGLDEALRGADAVLLPARGVDRDGRLPAPPGTSPLDAAAVLTPLPPGTAVLVGRVPPWLASAARRSGLRLEAYGEDEAFAAANAVPTAEGAIAEATRLAGRTVAGAAALVAGFGRVGEALAVRLRLWCADVTVVERSPGGRARAAAHGCRACGLEELAGAAESVDLAFNTIPAPVWTRSVLEALARRDGAVLVDLASPPGGTDFAAAEAVGVTAVLVPGVPGRWFPRTAGEILARTAERLLLRLFPGPGTGSGRGGAGSGAT
jgi:dipicolinate synthase subunit A